MKRELFLKICGMRDQANILEVAGMHTDYMGFIFYSKSPRFVGNEFTIPAEFPESIRKVAVFVNAETDEILSVVRKHSIHLVQLHGSESPRQTRELHQQGIKVIKAFSIDEDFDFKCTEAYAPYVAFFLFDTKGKNFGGNGQRFNWSLVYKYNGTTPFFLSGGIQPHHMEEVKSIQHPGLAGVDVNSGVEAAPGRKSMQLVNELIETINN